jgi:hypothetical protein
MFPNTDFEIQNLINKAHGNTLKKKNVKQHLVKLQGKFCHYKNRRQDDCIPDPFQVEMGSVTLPSNEEALLLELSFDRRQSIRFPEMTLPMFWSSVSILSSDKTHTHTHNK